MADPQNAQLAGFDLSALAGVSPEQVAAIAHLLQSGRLAMPPAMSTAPPSASALTPSHARERSSARSTAVVSSEEDVSRGKEEGEVEEGEASENIRPREFLRPPPTGPRRQSLVMRDKNARSALDQSPAKPNGQKTASGKNRAPPSLAQPNASAGQRVSKDAASRSFVREMIKAGYKFEDLAKEIGNTKALRKMFIQMGLPTPQAVAHRAQQAEPSRTVGSGVTPTVGKGVQKPAVPKESLQGSASKRPAPAKQPPEDRGSYLARLQAAQKKKTPAAATKEVATPLEKPEHPRSAAVTPVKVSPLPVQLEGASKTAESSPATSKQATAQNELIKKRLAAVQAQQAAKLKRDSANTMTSPSTLATATSTAGPTKEIQAGTTPAQHESVPDIAGIASAPGAPAVTQPPSRTVSEQGQQSIQDRPHVQHPAPTIPSARPHTGLPGLFLNNAAGQTSHLPPSAPPVMNYNMPTAPPAPSTAFSVAPESAGVTPTASPASMAVLRKRAVVSDFDASASNPAPPKRPFGLSRSDSEQQRFVINVSDDEDDDEKMQVDGDGQQPPGQHGKDSRPASTHWSLPPKPSFTQPPSKRGAVGYTMPDTTALAQKEKDLAEYRRRLAEMQSNRKRKPDATGSADTTTASTPNPAASPQSVLQSTLIPSNVLAASNLDSRNVEDYNQPSDEQIAIQQAQNTTPMPQEAHASSSDQPSSPAGKGSASLASEPGEVSDGSRVNKAQSPHNLVDAGSTGSKLGAPVTEDADMADAGSSDSDESEEYDPSANDDMMEAVTIQTGQKMHQFRQRESLSPGREIHSAHEEMPEQDADAGDAKSGNPKLSDKEDDFGSDSLSVSSSESEEDKTAALNSESWRRLKEDVVEPTPIPLPSMSTAQSVLNYAPDDDDLAPELQPSPAEQNGILDQNQPAGYPTPHFKPYESALTKFKDYKYHSDFLQTVPGGFKSLTYSHKLDPDLEVCPAEANGGECQDADCGLQHFAYMGLTDTELLRIMGTRNVPTHNPADKKRWNDGLSAVVKQLKSDPTAGRDAVAIAARIAEFRKEFLGDETSVVHFG